MGSVLFVAAFDSQLKWCAQLRKEFAARGFRWRVLVPDVRSALSADQIAGAGFTEVEPASWAETVSAATTSDVVVSALSGPTTESLLFDVGAHLAEQRGAGTEPRQRTPVLVTGWVGVIIENATGGYLNRCASDVIAVNCGSDLRHFARVASRLGLPTANLLACGLPILSGARAPQGEGPIRRVLFADQPTVPRDARERLAVYERLLAYAEAHPDRQIVLKPRHRLGEDTFHRMRHHPETLLAGRDLPANFGFDYAPGAERLPGTDLLLTVSSTACLEAVDAGCRVGLVLDLGVHERLGNHVFLDSGLLRTFDQITADELGVPEQEWLEDYFSRSASAAASIADRTEELLGSGERPSRAVRATPYHASAADFRASARSGARPLGRSRSGWRGQLVSLSHAVLPPVLVRPVRRLANQTRVLR
jgi:hypothetical protein